MDGMAFYLKKTWIRELILILEIILKDTVTRCV